jgi:hypothetical protein
MSPVIARSVEIPRPPGPPRPPEVPPPPPPFPSPHVPIAPVPPPIVHIGIPQVPALPPTWEYRHLTRPTAEPALDEAELNTLGRDGWELVGVVADARGMHFYFKRERA